MGAIIHAEDRFRRADPVRAAAEDITETLLRELDRAGAQRYEPRPAPRPVAKFTAGEAYTCSSPCDSGCIWTYTVVSRTASTIRLRDQYGEIVTRRVKVDSDGTEYVMPHGTYSMAAVLSARRRK